jgi:hypothetical protein
MAGTLGELAYETHRASVGYTSRNGQYLRPFAELRQSLEGYDVLTVQAWEMAAEKVAKVVREQALSGGATECRPLVNPQAPEVDRP